MLNVNMESFEKEVLQAEGKVLVDFWAPWCGPCQMVLPLLPEVEANRPQVKVVKVNVDEQPELAKKMRVMSIPTLFVFEDGKQLKRKSGAMGLEELLELVD